VLQLSAGLVEDFTEWNEDRIQVHRQALELRRG
jgi:hypothetical protein